MENYVNNTHHKEVKKEPLILTGTIINYDSLNTNNRIYTKEICEKIIYEYSKKIKDGLLMGEFNPDYNGNENIMKKYVSHLITDIRLNENNKTVECDFKILETLSGKILKGLIDIDMINTLSLAPRGMGNLNENKEVENYKLISIDIILKKDSSFKGSIQFK